MEKEVGFTELLNISEALLSDLQKANNNIKQLCGMVNSLAGETKVRFADFICIDACDKVTKAMQS